MPLILDLRITHELFGSSSDPSLNGNLHYPNDIDRSLNESVTDKIRKYLSDYNKNPPVTVSFIPDIVSTSVFLTSGVQVEQHDRGLFHFPRSVFSVQVKEKVGRTLVKTAVLRITLNLDGTPITSKSHTHLTHPQSSRLLTSSLSLGVPVPRATQCMGGV